MPEDPPIMPVVPSQEADQHTITQDVAPSLALTMFGPTGWWNTQTVENMPQESQGWMLANGWVVTNTREDTNTQPHTFTYDMTRESLQNERILLDLINSYQWAAIDARSANETRYNDVVRSWTETLESTQEHFKAQVVEQNEHVDAYLGSLDAYMDAVQQLITDNESAMADAVAAAVVLNNSGDVLGKFEEQYEPQINALLADYTAYVTDFSAINNILDDDWDAHAETSREFLTGLGATELDRIKEAFKATLATQLQLLTDQGAYNSERAIAITARNTRDHNEAIAELNDRLNREKLTNQHQLFDQQAAMRGRTMDGTDRLYDRKVAMRQGSMAGEDRLHALQQEILRYRVAQELQNAEAIVNHRHKAIVELMNVYAVRLAEKRGKHEENMKLMMYQLDERNKVLVGLYGFVERRDDVGPNFSDLAQVCTALGDAGGGWLTP